MKVHNRHRVTENETDALARPCAAGLIAGTLALMTTWAAPEPAARVGAQAQRALIARKLAANLHLLRDHPDIGPGLQQVIGRLHPRWVLLAHGAPEGAAASAAGLH